MSDRRKPQLRDGWPQSVAALMVVIATAGVIAVSTWSVSQTAGRLAVGGIVIFALALVLGSGRLVTITSVPILGAGLITLVRDTQPSWIRGMVIGVLWYVAAELAWDAIERRDGVRRSAGYNARRIDETTRVVILSLAVSAVAILGSSIAPVRTIFILIVGLFGVAAVMTAAARTLRRSGS